MMALVKILHAVSAFMAAAHLCFAVGLSTYFDMARPRRPDAFSGAIYSWGSDEDQVYITAHDQTVLYGFGVVVGVSLLVCGALTLILKMDARRDGRTTLY